MKEANRVKPFFKGINHKLFAAIALIIASLLVISCTATSKKLSSEGQNVSSIAQTKVIILPPTLWYESISDESILNASEYRGQEVEMMLKSSASEILRSKGFDIESSERLSKYSTRFELAYNRILDERINFFRSSLDGNLVSDLKEICESSDHANILAVHLKVKLGPHGYWNPYTGQIGSGMSYARLKAVLIETDNGRPLWKNQVQLREIPIPDDTDFLEAINLLFKNLKFRKD